MPVKDKATAIVTTGVVMPWSHRAAAQMNALMKECLKANVRLDSIRSTGQGLPYKAGFAAEALHAETFNLEAILQGNPVRAFTDCCPGTPLSRNHQVHDLLLQDTVTGETVSSVQVKYYADADKTANALREPRYQGAEQLVTPSDQTAQVRDYAHRTALKNGETRPEVAQAASHVAENASSKIMHDGVESHELSLKDARTIAQDNDQARDAHQAIQDKYQCRSTVSNAVSAAASAAALASIVAGTIGTIDVLGRVKAGEIELAEAVREVLATVGIAAVDSALKAGAATATVSTLGRKVPELFSGGLLTANLAAGAAAGVTVCAVDLAECFVLVAVGKMTMAQLEERTGANLFQTAAGVVGSTVGGAIGAAAGPLGVMIGGLIGGLISSYGMTVALEIGVAAPYRQTLLNAESVMAATGTAASVAQRSEQASRLVGWLDAQWRQSEVEVDAQLALHARSRADLARRINEI